MAAQKLRPVLSQFYREINYSLRLVRLVDDVMNAYQPRRGPKLSRKELELITELSFSNIFVAYETFNENSFIKYMLGGEASHGYKPRRYVFPKDEEHARKMTLQDYIAYTDWSSPDKIKRRAEYCFRNGEPYKQNIDLFASVLQNIKTIRNYIAHSSFDAKEKFENMARQYLGVLPVGRDLKAGVFLLMPTPRNPAQSFIEFFCEELRSFSERIVP